MRVYPLFFILYFLFSSFGIAQAKPSFYQEEGIALGGYDVVAYFTEGKSRLGEDSIQATYEGLKWFFSSTSHQKLFLQNPTLNLPQYGGYCAYGLAHYRGRYKISGEMWEIIDGKLYLFHPAPQVYLKWRANRENLIKKGDKRWRKIKH